MHRRGFGALVGTLLLSPRAFALESPVSPQQTERDEIFSLAVLDMVYRDWQSSTNGRGHNIGSILVDSQNRPLFWARNSVTVTNNATQHGEVRLIQAFLNCQGVGKYMSGYTIYTTLEPCAMCTGMIAMTQLNRVVYVQADPEFGHALAGLQHVRFPRLFQQDTVAASTQKQQLEKGWAEYRASHEGSVITDYLLSGQASEIYGSASADLLRFQVKNAENHLVLAETLDFLSKVGPETFGERMQDRCPVNL